MGLFSLFKRKAPVPVPVPTRSDLPMNYGASDHREFELPDAQSHQRELAAAMAARGKPFERGGEPQGVHVSLHGSAQRGAPIQVRVWGYVIGNLPQGDIRNEWRRELAKTGTFESKTLGHVWLDTRGVWHLTVREAR